MSEQNAQFNLVQLGNVANTCTCFNLRKATRVVTQFFDEQLKPSGLLITQFTILVAIAQAGSGTINDLADLLVMDRTTLTRNLKPLEREGFVAIQPGEDRRIRVVSLTAKGRNALAVALPLWERAQTSVINGLGQQQWNSLLIALNDYVSRGR
ncbi:winged helix-turn-helix transcriptional regulator [Chroococcidiopsis sp. FACHB-1243]|uniref:MarR family winged helix-turn-helix transcriptional regulator n=1 Tax=Chroococcidiopsis sp. [FACHB-1243] TaxID=2692781 RepID=UPI00177BD5F2|nr:MarR family winged helix-turn-helix transcriptional regulator [Chroococcidiopsis sp. [FACHB-1243]]MBD2308505.1 winged helix-turn-helix transcriptional regulator [Chroococcidiopsis sp. [FACHB-1243]]